MSVLMMRMMRRFMEGEGGSEGGSGSGGGGGTQTPPTKGGNETFSREYVQELRHENAGYRTKAQEAAAAKEAAETAAKKAADDAAAAIAAANNTANERIIRAELKAAALKAGMVDLDGLKLADLSKVKLNDAGEVEGADELMAAMKESKPYLFGAASTTTSTETKPKPGDKAPTSVVGLSKEEYAAARKKAISGR